MLFVAYNLVGKEIDSSRALNGYISLTLGTGTINLMLNQKILNLKTDLRWLLIPSVILRK
jgi:hypothetical protein